MKKALPIPACDYLQVSKMMVTDMHPQSEKKIYNTNNANNNIINNASNANTNNNNCVTRTACMIQ